MEEIKLDPQENPQVVPETKKTSLKTPLVAGLIIVLLGVVTGYALVQRNQPGGSNSTSSAKGEIVGSTNNKVFKDTATGVIEKGGLDGEGTHKLIRDGGPSQTAYLNSSVIDLDEFVGKKVQVWGETNKGQKAGWLMDVGKVQVL